MSLLHWPALAELRAGNIGTLEGDVIPEVRNRRDHRIEELAGAASENNLPPLLSCNGALKHAENHLSPANCELGRAFEQKGDLEEAYRQYRIAYQAHLSDEQCRAAYKQLKLGLKK